MRSVAIVAAISLVGAEAAARDFRSMSIDELTGALDIDPAAVADWPKATLTRAYIPDAIDLSPLMPPPAQQEHGSCVSFAVGYAARGYYSAIAKKTSPGSASDTPSAAFLHSQIFNRKKGTCQSSGSDAATAINYLTGNGLPTDASVPLTKICSPEIIGASLPRNEFSVVGKRAIFIQQQKNSKPSTSTLDIIKQYISLGHPVVVGFRLFLAHSKISKEVTTLDVLRGGDVYRGSLEPNLGGSFGHAMVFVGYDEGRQAFRVQNSWGRDWADGGYGWIGYDAARADMISALVMDASVQPPKPAPMRPKQKQDAVKTVNACSRVTENVDPNLGVALRGFVSTELDLTYFKLAYSSEQLKDVAVRPWPICETLLTLQEPLAAPSRPKIELLSGDGSFRFGETMGFKVTAPNFPSFLYVAYLQADGTVVNLVPRGGPIRRQFAPGAVLTFGDGKDGRQTFRASAPAGSEAIVVIASRSPLAGLEALEKDKGQFRLAASNRGDDNDDEFGEGADDRLYLSTLRAALAETHDDTALGRETTADVAYLTVSEK